jgi:pyruvate,water dikinase
MAWWKRGPRNILRRIAALGDPKKMDEAALLAKAEEILRVWSPILRARFYASSAIQVEPLLRKLVTLAAGRRERDGVMADLMTGLPSPTLEINRELWRLSRLARNNETVLSAVRAEDPARLGRSEEGRAFLGEFRQFLGTYGHREGIGWYLSTFTWRSDPLQVYRLLAHLAALDTFPDAPDQAESRYRASRDRALRGLRFYPGLGRLFCRLVDGLRVLQVFREESHLDLCMPLDAVQQITRELGSRFAARGSLAGSRDIYYLTFDEIKAWSLGTWPPPDEIRNLVARRRATYRAANANWQRERLSGRSDGSTLKGIGVSPGVASAPVRVVSDQGQFHRLRPGEVLVCPHTTPAWTPLFASLSAVVTETGGTVSHAAIVAREYGIPAVMAVPGATRTLATGEEVLVDGNRGTVTRLSASRQNEHSKPRQEL